MASQDTTPRPRSHFADDFRRFFLRGLAALMPTLITLWLLIKVWDFLWESLGKYLIWFFTWVWYRLASVGVVSEREAGNIKWLFWVDGEPRWWTQVLGVVAAIVLVYVIGLLVGNLIGRTLYRLGENAIFKIPLIRAIYPSVKQVVDFVLSDKKAQFAAGNAESRVVAVEPHANGIWSIGLVTGKGVRALGSPAGKEMVTVFIPSSPTACSGCVLVVPREVVYDLPLTVDQAMRLLVSGGVIDPNVETSATEMRSATREQRLRELIAAGSAGAAQAGARAPATEESERT